jgi:transcriptional regulator GlxA family with amidase domain
MACLTSAIEPLRSANEIVGRREFAWRLVAETADPVPSSAGIRFEPDEVLQTSAGLDHLYILAPPRATFVYPSRSPARLRWLDRTGIVLGGFSGGIFPLSRAGLMEGRTSSVHWCYEAAFKAEFPNVVSSDSTIVRDRRRNTVSGAAAVFELMLQLIDERLGQKVVIEVACWFQHRYRCDTDASQTVPVGRADCYPDNLSQPIREAIHLFGTHLEDTLRIPDVAAAVGMSGRHFERLFKYEIGQSPLRYYHFLRLAKARQRVLYSDDPLGDIAASVGYLTLRQMIRRYEEEFGVNPRDDRRMSKGPRNVTPAEAQSAE